MLSTVEQNGTIVSSKYALEPSPLISFIEVVLGAITGSYVANASVIVRPHPSPNVVVIKISLAL